MRSQNWIQSLVFLFYCFFGYAVSAQIVADRTFSKVNGAAGRPISSVLDKNGSVERGVSGSFDPKGYRMVTGKDGAPRFVTNNNQNLASTLSGCNDGWDDRFGTNGVNGAVIAMASDGSGNLYIGGQFSAAGGVVANNVAKWNGSSWSALGSGVNADGGSFVNDVAISGTDVYVGGYFTTAGGIAANNVAKWDGSRWSAVGSGTDDIVIAIEASGTDVYVGGLFAVAGGISVSHVAKWDGSNWSALGSGAGGVGVDSVVLAIAVSGTDVYVGGSFTEAGGTPANRVAKWDGSSWSSLGSGVECVECYADPPYVNTIAAAGTDVYVSGVFSTAGGIAANKIAKWNGSNWSVLGLGLDIGASDLELSGGDLYVGGDFSEAGGVRRSRIAKWNGYYWSSLGAGIDGTVRDIEISGTDVYVGGEFQTAGCHAAINFSRYSPPKRVAFDFDGDRKSDVSIYRSGTAAEWWVLKSSDGAHFATRFGATGDIMTPADFTGDGNTDIAFFRPSTGQWFIMRSEDGSYLSVTFGLDGDIPMPSDYDGDGLADVAVFRPSLGLWFILRSSTGAVDIIPFGISSDLPVAADYDGDGKADIAIFRRNGASGAQWWVLRSSNQNHFALEFGSSTDKAVPGDYTGDGKADMAFWRESTGQWFVLRSEDFSYYAFPFGVVGDMPAPGDFDGDGKMDAGIFRQPGSQWWVNKSSGGAMIATFGTQDDVPVHCAYVR